jgi:hypothetical protein
LSRGYEIQAPTPTDVTQTPVAELLEKTLGELAHRPARVVGNLTALQARRKANAYSRTRRRGALVIAHT